MNIVSALFPINRKYRVTEDGVITNAFTGQIIPQFARDRRGYMVVMLDHRKREYVHRMVALTFLPNPNHLKHVDHIDRNVRNNHCHNLRWVTSSNNGANSLGWDTNRVHALPKNVYYNSCGGYDVKIMKGRETVVYAYFTNLDEAAIFAEESRRRVFGEFAVSLPNLRNSSGQQIEEGISNMHIDESNA